MGFMGGGWLLLLLGWFAGECAWGTSGMFGVTIGLFSYLSHNNFFELVLSRILLDASGLTYFVGFLCSLSLLFSVSRLFPWTLPTFDDSFFCISFFNFRFFSTLSATDCKLMMLLAYSFAFFSCFGDISFSVPLSRLSLLELRRVLFSIVTTGLLTMASWPWLAKTALILCWFGGRIDWT